MLGFSSTASPDSRLWELLCFDVPISRQLFLRGRIPFFAKIWCQEKKIETLLLLPRFNLVFHLARECVTLIQEVCDDFEISDTEVCVRLEVVVGDQVVDLTERCDGSLRSISENCVQIHSASRQSLRFAQ
eukprot:Blabericola_migrator_1__262@NODE_1069_length_5537_cov_108_299452_g79_i1_p5_GENE_NODE_1069_length_5537_cov_108_299452_g79_i1NODE_1069_length_5537_cov_108_299452_g79_i1_p5_ORF_typecomplete_len130_score24_23DUF4215/PF13948_6/35_NODE_1069_length_5537_cov_108_299452_g79_i111521541